MKTRRDLFYELSEVYGIKTLAGFYPGLDEKMTDEEYEKALKFHLSLVNDDDEED
ncbi:hypothetical protein QUW13_02800 [Enterococcus hirae]|nr:hypothetical protein [Enterococcus hirae]